MMFRSSATWRKLLNREFPVDKQGLADCSATPDVSGLPPTQRPVVLDVRQHHS